MVTVATRFRGRCPQKAEFHKEGDMPPSLLGAQCLRAGGGDTTVGRVVLGEGTRGEGDAAAQRRLWPRE